jgi:hypothetical protein
MRPFLLLTFPFLLPACSFAPEEQDTRPNFASYTSPDEFASYWFQGLAELSSYDLYINRYGENRRGDAVLVFVTEDISASRHVKLDNPELAQEGDKVAVLKLNALWKFKTGIYDYSLMESLFTPVEFHKRPRSLKQTGSFQDWCGQSFQQLNLRKKGYQFQQFSYFETEGDQSHEIEPEMLEDELFTLLRINPSLVPSGEFDLLPGAFFLRLSHEAAKPKRARIQFLESEATTQCLVEYMHMDRTLRIHFETAFPHRILSWTEEKGGKIMVQAKLRKTINSAYWTQNAGEFLPLRDSLKLNF